MRSLDDDPKPSLSDLTLDDLAVGQASAIASDGLDQNLHDAGSALRQTRGNSRGGDRDYQRAARDARTARLRSLRLKMEPTEVVKRADSLLDKSHLR